MPVYFQSFGDWKLPVYVYATVPSIALFGLTGFAVRFPSAVFGILTIPAMYFFVKEVFREKGTNMVALFSAGMLAINPWHLHYTRATFEVSIALFLFVFGSYLLLRWLRERFSGGLFLGTVLYIIAAYSYNLTRLLAPLLFISVVWWGYDRSIRMGRIRHVRQLWSIEPVAALIAGVLLFTPMAMGVLQDGGVSSASGTIIFSSAAVQAPLLEFRSYLMDIPSGVTRLLFNQLFLTLFEYVRHIVSYFSVDFFFIHGSSHGNHGIRTIGQFYIIELLLMVLGLVWLLRTHIYRRSAYFFVVWWVIVVAVASLTREAPHATRSFFLIVPMIICSAAGVRYTCDLFSSRMSWKHHMALSCFVACIAGVGVYQMIMYVASYYYQFPVLYAAQWRAGDEQLTDFLVAHGDEYDMVAIDPAAGYIYSSYLFYASYPPDIFQDTVVRMPPDSEGFTPVAAFGSLLYVDRLQLGSFSRKKILYVTSPNARREQDNEVLKITYPRRPVVINLGQKIISYPVEETAYIVVEVNSK